MSRLRRRIFGYSDHLAPAGSPRCARMYGYVPTHGPSCVKVRAYPTKCPTCKKPVIYFECSCGSKVFLRLARGGQHVCRLPPKPPPPKPKVRRRPGPGSTKP